MRFSVSTHRRQRRELPDFPRIVPHAQLGVNLRRECRRRVPQQSLGAEQAHTATRQLSRKLRPQAVEIEHAAVGVPKWDTRLPIRK